MSELEHMVPEPIYGGGDMIAYHVHEQETKKGAFIYSKIVC